MVITSEDPKFPQAFKRYTEMLVQYCQNAVWCGYYKGKIQYEDKDSDWDEHASLHAAISINTAYSYFTVRVTSHCVAQWKQKEYSECGDTILHEMVHLLTEPLCDLAKSGISPVEKWSLNQIVEQTVVKITRIISDNLPKEWYTPDYLEGWVVRADVTVNTPKDPAPEVV